MTKTEQMRQVSWRLKHSLECGRRPPRRGPDVSALRYFAQDVLQVEASPPRVGRCRPGGPPPDAAAVAGPPSVAAVDVTGVSG